MTVLLVLLVIVFLYSSIGCLGMLLGKFLLNNVVICMWVISTTGLLAFVAHKMGWLN